MSYYKVLRTAIAESGYTNKQILEELNQRGKKIDKAYLSRLLNNKVPAPSEDISRLIANICNIDERKLVLEGYLDKAPKEIKEALLSIKSLLYIVSTSIFENKIDDQTMLIAKQNNP